MPITLIEPPEAEPVTLDEAKAFARVADNDGRAFRTVISAARELVENYTGRQLLDARHDARLLRRPSAIRLV